MKSKIILLVLMLSTSLFAATTINYTDGSITLEKHRDNLKAITSVRIVGERAESLLNSLQLSLQQTTTYIEYQKMLDKGVFHMSYGGGHYTNLENMDGELICREGSVIICEFSKDRGQYNKKRFPFFPAKDKLIIKSDNVVTSKKAMLNVSDDNSTKLLFNILDKANLCTTIAQRCYGTCTNYCRLTMAK